MFLNWITSSYHNGKNCGPARRRKGSALAEFPVVLFILFLIIVFPLIDLIGLATGMVTVAVLTNETATRAANQANYNTALSVMVQQANSLLQTGFAHFANLKPVGGYQACGSDLYVNATNYRGGASKTFAPNTALPPPIDASTFIYEYNTKAVYDVGPTLSLDCVPFIGMIPGIGKPARITYSVCKVAEHPEGLDNGQYELAMANIDNSSVAKFNRAITYTNPSTAISGGTLGNGGSGWNYPQIYQAIAQAGETVVSENVLIVKASQYPWTDTGVATANGEQVWFDWRADGVASAGTQWGKPQGPAGYPASTGLYTTAAYFNFTPGSLIGKMGGSSAANTGAAPFLIGSALYNYKPSANGEVFLRYNDSNTIPSWFTDNSGEFIVRVIVTK